MAFERERLARSQASAIFKDQIVPTALARLEQTPAPGDKKVIIVLGHPGAGTAVAAHAAVRELDPKSTVLVATEQLREFHPTWQSRAPGYPAPEQQTRGDAERWADSLTKEATKRGANIVLSPDRVDSDSVSRGAANLRAQGYQVEVHFVTRDLEAARQLVAARYANNRATEAAPRFADDATIRQQLGETIRTAKTLESEQAVDRTKVFAAGKLLYANHLHDGNWKHAPRADQTLESQVQAIETPASKAGATARWEHIAERLSSSQVEPSMVRAAIESWRHDAVEKMTADPEAKQMYARGANGNAFLTIPTEQLADRLPQFAKQVERLKAAQQAAQENFANKVQRDQFIDEVRRRIAKDIAAGKVLPDVKRDDLSR